jgi:predicted transcriptional regulator
MDEHAAQISPVELAVAVTTAWLSNPSTRATADEVVAFVGTVHAALVGLAGSNAVVEKPAAPIEERAAFEPAVTVRKSLASKEHIISLIDGKSYKTLRRHLSTHGLTPESYRERFGLKADYPMTAPAYSERRRDMAKSIGLGRKPERK